jgi:AraC-like DNA-binding protein
MKSTSRLEPAADFASSAMVRVLARGMRDLGMDTGLATPGSAGRVATVSLDEKRQLVGSALAQGGIGCLALLGRGLHSYTHEPSHRALVSALDAQDLFERWARLERYIHSRHRTEVVALSDRRVHVTHLARTGSPPPLPVEDLVVLGVWVALLEAIGATQVSARIGEVPVYPQPDAAALARLAERGGTSTWFIEWAPIPALFRKTRADAALVPTITAPQTWPPNAQQAFAAMCADLMKPLSLPALAQVLGEAPRSLQRSLSRAGLSHSQLLVEARSRSVAWWLMSTALPLAEVGFVSGYADQSHFTRDFRNRVGMTPLRYRTEFYAVS